MSESGKSGPGKPSWLTPRQRAGVQASVMWLVENVLGAIPLFAYLLIHHYRSPVQIYVCSPDARPSSQLASCSLVIPNIAQELCILTVVIAGLAALSFVQIGPGARQAKPTTLSVALVGISVISLVVGAILYAMASTYQIRGVDLVTIAILVAATLSSYFLKLEEAILDA